MVTMMTMFEEAPMTEKMKDALTHRLRRTRNPIRDRSRANTSHNSCLALEVLRLC